MSKPESHGFSRVEYVKPRELRIVASLCKRNFPDKAVGGDSDQMAVSDFVDELEDMARKKKSSSAGTYLTRTHLAEIAAEN